MTHRLLTVSLLFVLSGCRFAGGSKFRAEPVSDSGVKVELKAARAKNDRIEVDFRFHNETDQPLTIDRNQLAVVSKDGDLFRSGGDNAFSIAGGKSLDGRLVVTKPGAELDEEPGFFVRFDGVYFGEARVNLPPMKLGKPGHGPGDANLAFKAPAADAVKASEGGLAERLAAASQRLRDSLKSDGSAGTTETASASTGYTGPRKKVKAAGLKCATMPMQMVSMPKGIGDIVDELLLTELQSAGFEAIGPDDINAMMGLERMKEAAACDDQSCMAEIGNALGVDYLATGKAAKLEGSTVVTLKLMAVRESKVLARSQKMVEGGDNQLPKIIGEAVQEIVTRSNL